MERKTICCLGKWLSINLHGKFVMTGHHESSREIIRPYDSGKKLATEGCQNEANLQ